MEYLLFFLTVAALTAPEILFLSSAPVFDGQPGSAQLLHPQDEDVCLAQVTLPLQYHSGPQW